MATVPQLDLVPRSPRLERVLGVRFDHPRRPACARSLFDPGGASRSSKHGGKEPYRSRAADSARSRATATEKPKAAGVEVRAPLLSQSR